MRVKRKTIIFCSINIVLLLLSTHTTIGVVEYNSINNERERLVIEYEERTIIQLLKNRLRYTSPCGCEDEERDNSLICSILFMLFIVPYSFYILLLSLFWGYLIIMNILEIILTITGLPFLRLAEEINCEWTNNFPLQLLYQHKNDIILP